MAQLMMTETAEVGLGRSDNNVVAMSAPSHDSKRQEMNNAEAFSDTTVLRIINALTDAVIAYD